MSSPIHFYLTFNPRLNKYVETGFTQAHEFYEYLQGQIKKDSDGYAYWGKVIGEDREKKDDTQRFRDVIEENKKNGHSTHLYLTDYENLWVAKVDDVVHGIGKDFKTLEFYRDKKVELWFKISDFTILEYSHETTAAKLGELYIDNPHMEFLINGLSPFTSGIKYPALIQDLAEESYFDELDEEQGKLVLRNPEAILNMGSSKVIKLLKTYVFKEDLYNKIPHAAKSEIESAEMDMIENRHHNLNKVAFSYIKAFEIILNHLVVHQLKKAGVADEFYVKPNVMPPKLYLNDYDEEGLIPLGQFQKNFSINQLVYFCDKAGRSNRLDFQRAFKDQKPFIKWVTSELPKILEENQILAIRGILAHSDSHRVEEGDLMAIRNLILGVGCTGLINTAYKKFDKDLLSADKVNGSYTEVKSGASTQKKNHLKLAS